jgi:hypothetical protein
MRFLAADQRQAGTEPRIAYVLGICEQGGVEHKFRTMVKDKAAGKKAQTEAAQDWDEKFRRAAPCHEPLLIPDDLGSAFDESEWTW